MTAIPDTLDINQGDGLELARRLRLIVKIDGEPVQMVLAYSIPDGWVDSFFDYPPGSGKFVKEAGANRFAIRRRHGAVTVSSRDTRLSSAAAALSAATIPPEDDPRIKSAIATGWALAVISIVIWAFGKLDGLW